MGIVEWMRRSALIVASVLCFVLAIGLALADKIAGATLMAGMFVVSVILHYLPELESFKAYGVEAKWRERIAQADVILAKLKDAAIMSGKLAYHTLGSQSRMWHPVRRKQALADELDSFLREMNVSEAELMQMKNEYLYFAEYDLFSIYRNLCRACIDSAESKTRNKLMEIQRRNDGTDQGALHAKTSALSKMRDRALNIRIGDFDFDKVCDACTPEKDLIGDELSELLGKARRQLRGLAERCRAEGRVVDEAGEMIEKRGAFIGQELRDAFMKAGDAAT